MQDFKFDLSGDLVINELKQVETVSGVDKVKQDIIHILKCIKGTDTFHPDFGVDWLKIKRSGFNRMLIEHEIRKALAGYDKIESIEKIEISPPDQSRSVRIKLFLTVNSKKTNVEVVV